MKKIILILAVLTAALTLSAQFDAKSAELNSGIYALMRSYQVTPLVVALWDAKTKFPLSLFIRASTGKPAFQQNDITPASVNVFLFENGNDIVQIDAGYGHCRDLLKEAGIEAKDVTAVMLTHVHPDHIGGLLAENETAAYPMAKIWLSEPEAKALKDPKHKMHAAWRKILAAYPADRIVLFRYGQKNLPGGLEAVAAPGHTPGHTVFKRSIAIDKDGNRQDIWFIGDLLHAAKLQFAVPDICAKFDADPAQAVKSRLEILTLIERGTVVMFDKGSSINPSFLCGAHLPFPGIGRITAFSNMKGFDYAGAVQ